MELLQISDIWIFYSAYFFKNLTWSPIGKYKVTFLESEQKEWISQIMLAQWIHLSVYGRNI